MNVTSFVYFIFRLLPFILVSNFIISSFINSEVKGFVYLIGLIITYFVNSYSLDYLGSPTSLNPNCNLFQFDEFLNPKMSLGIVIFAYTFGYLLFTVIKYKMIVTNLLMLTFFPLLIVFELMWNHVNKCSTFQNNMILLVISGLLGVFYSFIIDSFKLRGLQYFNIGSNSELCSRPSKQKLKCTTYKNGEAVSFTVTDPNNSQTVISNNPIYKSLEAYNTNQFINIDGRFTQNEASRYSTGTKLSTEVNETDCEQRCFSQPECSVFDNTCAVDYDDSTNNCSCKFKKTNNFDIISSYRTISNNSEGDNTSSADTTSFFSLDVLNDFFKEKSGILHKDKVYYFANKLLSIENHEKEAQSMNGTIISIHNNDEYNVVRELQKKEDVILGAIRTGVSQEDWKWLDNTPWDSNKYTLFWKRNQPDNRHMRSRIYQKIIVMNGSTGKWDDLSDSTPYKSVYVIPKSQFYGNITKTL